ncbi:hypothetical protein [Ferrimonas pelagia]|uniref:Uncharacterized protein n=1 Tax=Ferrimonas pelagia TaxID=1177826 RepID=A0ABP9FKU9_9GAMM
MSNYPRGPDVVIDIAKMTRTAPEQLQQLLELEREGLVALELHLNIHDRPNYSRNLDKVLEAVGLGQEESTGNDRPCANNIIDFNQFRNR